MPARVGIQVSLHRVVNANAVRLSANRSLVIFRYSFSFFPAELGLEDDSNFRFKVQNSYSVIHNRQFPVVHCHLFVALKAGFSCACPP
jgi:hypothetical protein